MCILCLAAFTALQVRLPEHLTPQLTIRTLLGLLKPLEATAHRCAEFQVGLQNLKFLKVPEALLDRLDMLVVLSAQFAVHSLLYEVELNSGQAACSFVQAHIGPQQARHACILPIIADVCLRNALLNACR